MSQKKTVQKRTVLDADMGSMDLLPLFNRRAGINRTGAGTLENKGFLLLLYAR